MFITVHQNFPLKNVISTLHFLTAIQKPGDHKDAPPQSCLYLGDSEEFHYVKLMQYRLIPDKCKLQPMDCLFW